MRNTAKRKPNTNGRKSYLRAEMCTELSYRIKTIATEFDLERFTAELGPTIVMSGWNETILDPLPGGPGNYHAHVKWVNEDKGDSPAEVRLRIEYHMWNVPPDSSEKLHPYAEEFFEWLGRFFPAGSVEVHVHAEFSFPSETWQTKIVPIPLKVPYAGKSAVITGVSIDLPSEPEGVKNAWINKHRKTLEVQLYADRRIEFKGFTPQNNIDAFRSVIKSLVEEKSS